MLFDFQTTNECMRPNPRRRQDQAKGQGKLQRGAPIADRFREPLPLLVEDVRGIAFHADAPAYAE